MQAFLVLHLNFLLNLRGLGLNTVFIIQLNLSIENFTIISNQLNEILPLLNSSTLGPYWNLTILNELNNNLIQVERGFLSDENEIFPYRDIPWYHHTIFAPALYGGYAP